MSDLFGSDLSDVEEFGSPASPPRTPTSPRKPATQARRDESDGGTPAPAEDLFGSDDDSEPVPARAQSATPPPSAHRDDLFGSDEEMSDAERAETTVRERVMTTSIPILPLPRSKDGQYVVVRAPNILHMEAAPFSADTYKDILDEEHQVAEQHGYKSAVTAELAAAAESIVANTVRWRLRDGRRESNARVVRWSDGSTTVVVGGSTPEVYGVNTEKLASGPKEKYYYATAAHAGGLGHAHARMTEQWLLRPARQSSQARSAVSLLQGRIKGVAGAGGGAQTARASRTQFIVVDEAPELQAKREEKEEERRERQRVREERIRERREAREIQANRSVGVGAAEYSDEDRGFAHASDREPARARAARRIPRQAGLVRPSVHSSYVDDDDDGFVVDDDVELEVGPQDDFDDEEEEELAAQRLKAAKHADYSSDDAPQRRVRGTKSRRQLDLDDDSDNSDVDDI